MFRRGERGAVSVAVLVIAGLGVAGAAGGAGLALGGGDDGDGASGLPLTPVGYYACPGDEDAAGVFHRGDRVIATGRDATGDWLQLRAPDLSSRVWVETRFVVADNQTDGLPTLDCSEEPTAPGAVGPGAAAPGEQPDGGGGTTGGGSDGGGGGGGSTDTQGPSIGAIGATPADIFEEYGSGSSQCINQTTSTITASISDPSGVASASLSWSFPGASGGGSFSGSGIWQGSIGPYPYGSYPVPSGGVDVTVTVTATDNAGNTATRSRTVRLHSAEECIV